MFWVWKPGFLNDNREYTQSLCFSWLRLSVLRLAPGTTAIPTDKAEDAEPSVRWRSFLGQHWKTEPVSAPSD